MIQEITVNQDGEVALLSWEPIAIMDYGSEGCTPLHRSDCPLSSGAVSCVSGSGDSICGGYFGHINDHVVRCHYPRKS